MSSWEWVPLAAYAMGTRFEFLLGGEEATLLRAAGEVALEEVHRLEALLSRFRSDSEVFHLNAFAAEVPVRVSRTLFHLLQRAIALSEDTEGAFDPTVAPLMRCWGFYQRQGLSPSSEQLAEALACVGMDGLQLDAKNCTVRFQRPGLELDLGAIGKGLALEEAGWRLREAGIKVALLHAGTSTVYALDPPPDENGWKIAVRHPQRGELAVVALRQEALAVSEVHGRTVTVEGRKIGHLLDPRTGQPVAHTRLAAAVTTSPTEADALSTAALVLGPQGCAPLAARRPNLTLLLLTVGESGKEHFHPFGPERFQVLSAEESQGSEGQTNRRGST